MQSMAQDLATMGQQVEELKATIAQLKAGQAQMARELAKTSEAKAGETRPRPLNGFGVSVTIGRSSDAGLVRRAEYRSHLHRRTQRRCLQSGRCDGTES